jgi:hypothetical protein
MISVRSVVNLIAGLALSAWVMAPTAGGAQSTSSSDLVSILGGLAERTQQYYDRFISIICTETVHQQELKSSLAPVGKPRITVYELSVTRGPRSKQSTDFRVERTLQSINGRPAGKNKQPECTDPKTVTAEPLGFLLSQNQSGFRFSLSADVTGGPPGTRAIDFVQTPPDLVKITWVAHCFEAEMAGVGRVWFDPDTLDVLRVEERLSKPPHFGLLRAIRIERAERVVEFARVKFEQPEETVLLPESIETLFVFRGAPSFRTIQKLGNYRRFLSESTIRGAERAK